MGILLTFKFEKLQKKLFWQKIFCEHLGGKTWLEEFKGFIKLTLDNTSRPQLYLSLRNTSIRDIKTPIHLAENYETILYLKLENNDIRTIAEDAFLKSDVEDMKNFSLHQNSLKLLPVQFFKDFDELVVLDLSHNHFQNMSDFALTAGKSFK